MEEAQGRLGLSKAQIVSIIDDNVSVRAGIQALVNSLGLVSTAFASAEDFLGSLRLEDTACLITDVQIPGISGLELQSRLAAEGRSIPVIFITAFPEQSGRERALAAGALAYLEKPFDGDTMTSLLREALARS
jgi:FixJ family two-component response regulator